MMVVVHSKCSWRREPGRFWLVREPLVPELQTGRKVALLPEVELEEQMDPQLVVVQKHLAPVVEQTHLVQVAVPKHLVVEPVLVEQEVLPKDRQQALVVEHL